MESFELFDKAKQYTIALHQLSTNNEVTNGILNTKYILGINLKKYKFIIDIENNI